MQQRGMARRHPPTAWLSRASLVLAVASSMLVIRSTDTLANQSQVELVLLASVAYLAMLAADHRWGGLSIGAVAAAGAGTAVVALSVPAFRPYAVIDMDDEDCQVED